MKTIRCWLALSLWVIVQSCSDDVDLTSPMTSETVAVVQAELVSALDKTIDTTAVIVNFREPLPAPVGLEQSRKAYRDLRENLLSKHGDGFVLSRRFSHVPAVAGRITKNALERLKRDPTVSYIQLDGTGHGCLGESVPAIGGDQVKKLYNVTGKGVRVAVLDSGVDTDHPDLKDSIVAQHCFTRNDCPPGRSNEGTSAEDDHGHGTNVTGVIASNGVVAPAGFAPNAEIVAVKIDDASNTGMISDWVAGLDWVYDNLSTLKVKVVNLSFCTVENYANAAECDSGQPALARAVKNLVDAGVTVFGATGNMGLTDGMCSPSCHTGTIAVAATYDSNVGQQPDNGSTFAMTYGFGVIANCRDATTAFDQIACFSNSSERLDIVAPGAPMDSDDLNGSTATLMGTSQAAPVGAAVAALMLECNPSLSPAEIKKIMVETGVKAKRGGSSSTQSFPSLRALAAVKAACPNLTGNAGAGGSGGAGAGGGGSGRGGAGAGGGSGRGGAGAAGKAGGTAGKAGTNAAGGTAISGSGGSVGPTAGGSSTTLIAGNTAVSGTAGGSASGTAGTFVTKTDSGSKEDGCGCSIIGSSSGRGAPEAALTVAIGLMLIVLRWRRRRVLF